MALKKKIYYFSRHSQLRLPQFIKSISNFNPRWIVNLEFVGIFENKELLKTLNNIIKFTDQNENIFIWKKDFKDNISILRILTDMKIPVTKEQFYKILNFYSLLPVKNINLIQLTNIDKDKKQKEIKKFTDEQNSFYETPGRWWGAINRTKQTYKKHS